MGLLYLRVAKSGNTLYSNPSSRESSPIIMTTDGIIVIIVAPIVGT